MSLVAISPEGGFARAYFAKKPYLADVRGGRRIFLFDCVDGGAASIKKRTNSRLLGDSSRIS